jgi:hypothetical protein
MIDEDIEKAKLYLHTLQEKKAASEAIKVSVSNVAVRKKLTAKSASAAVGKENVDDGAAGIDLVSIAA